MVQFYANIYLNKVLKTFFLKKKKVLLSGIYSLSVETVLRLQIMTISFSVKPLLCMEEGTCFK